MEMFYSSFKKFIRVVLMFSMFLLCFSTAFYTLFHKAVIKYKNISYVGPFSNHSQVSVQLPGKLWL